MNLVLLICKIIISKNLQKSVISKKSLQKSGILISGSQAKPMKMPAKVRQKSGFWPLKFQWQPWKFFKNWASWKEGSGFRSYQACSNCSSTGCDVWNYDLQGQAWFSDTCPGVQSLVFSCCCLASRLLWCRKPFNRRKMSLSRIDTEGKMTGLLGELSTLQTNMGPVKFPRATRYPIKEANTYLNPYVFLGRRLTSPVGV